MNRFTTWLVTVPEHEELFFNRLRRDASALFDIIHEIGWWGHKWEYPPGNPGSSSVRRCPKCKREQWEQVKTIRTCTWVAVRPRPGGDQP